jgi:DNA-binding NarL/FixJ family response regulator
MSNVIVHHNKLSQREHEVLQLLCQGLTAKESAKQLHLSYRTVETYLENVKAKLGYRRRFELIRYGFEHKLV